MTAGVQHTGQPAGYTVSTPEAWIHTANGGVAALMRRLPLDGTELCSGDEAFTREGAYPEGELEILRATCAACKFQPACDEWALAHEMFDFWGGRTARERSIERAKRGLVHVERKNAAWYGLLPAPRVQETA